MKKILIFYSKSGGGHLRCAEALAFELGQIDPTAQISLVDCLKQTDWGFNIDPARGWMIFSTQFIHLFNLLFLLTNNNLGVKILRLLIKKTWGKTFLKIIATEQPDIIITTHHFISPSTIPTNVNMPFITIVTDLGQPHRIWFDKKADQVIVSSQSMANFAKQVVEATAHAEIINLGYPLKQDFNNKASRHKRSHKILITGGGSGAGQMEKNIMAILESFPKQQIIAVTGHNRKLAQKLDKLRNQRLQVLGFVNNMHELIKEADIVVSKAGPGSIMEAAVSSKPLIITEWVGLQEKDNVNFVVEHNLGIYAPNRQELIAAIKQIYEDYKKFSQPKIRIENGAKDITKFILHKTPSI